MAELRKIDFSSTIEGFENFSRIVKVDTEIADITIVMELVGRATEFPEQLIWHENYVVDSFDDEVINFKVERVNVIDLT